MKCLLLALGLALVCGLQAATIPPAMEDLDLSKVRRFWGGWGAAGRAEERGLGRLKDTGAEAMTLGNLPPCSPSSGRLSLGFPRSRWF